MTRLRTSALLLTATALAGGFLAQSANAAITPLSKLKADMGYLKTTENAYSKAHHGEAKTVNLEAGQVTHVGKYRVSARPQEQITVQPGHEGAKLGYCTTISYRPYHHSDGLTFAYYDSILRVTHWNTDHYQVGGACYSTAQEQSVIRGQMQSDVLSAAEVEQDYMGSNPSSYGATFTATDSRITTLPNGDIISAYSGDTVRGYANPSHGGYCVVVTNKTAKLIGHSYYYASTQRGQANFYNELHQGVFGTPTSGSCSSK